MKTIGDVSNKIFSGGTPNTRTDSYWNGDHKWLSSGETRNGFIYDTEKKITAEGIKRSSTKLAKAGSIVIASAGQGYTRGQTSMLMCDTYINQSIVCIEPNPELVNNYYLYYYLKNNYQMLRVMSDGHSSRGSITTKMIRDLEIDFPDLKTQGAIAGVLLKLDEKIYLNNRENETLEKLAFALYDEHCSGIGENNSKLVSLGEVADCKLGGTPSRAKPEYWNGSINWINSGAINLFRITEPSETISEEGLSHTSTYILPQGTTVLAITGATLGQVSRLEIESCTNQSVIGIIGNDIISNEYIYLTVCKNIRTITNKQTGGAQQHINKNDVNEFEFLLPKKEIMTSFTESVKPLFDKISLNCFENINLELLRNTLLRKYMATNAEGRNKHGAR